MKIIAIAIGILLLGACTDIELSEMHRLSNGAKVYKLNCANCHQESGEGLAQLMPPLQNSDWFNPNLLELPCLIKNGSKAPMTVNGVLYKQPMPALKHLTDAEIKDVSIYVAQKFAGLTWEAADSLFNQVPNSCN